MRKILLLLLILPLFLIGCVNSNSSSYSGYNSIRQGVSTEKVDDGCCKHCTTGKACGDSCISRSYTCHKGSGCACDY